MKNSLIILFLSLCFLQVRSQVKLAPVTIHGALQTEGNFIIGSNHNNPVQLRGMSLFWSQWLPEYYTAETVKWLVQDWKCTVIRAAIALDEGGYILNPELELNKLTTVIEEAIKQDVYVIVDIHSHHADEYEKEVKELLGTIAKTYGHYPHIIYEVFNEPLSTSNWNTIVKPYSEAVIDTIRFHDPDNLIICGSPNWSQDVDIASKNPIIDTNVAYALHYYAGSHRQTFRDKAQLALDNNVALFVTEFGTVNADGDGDINTYQSELWWEFLDENKISWVNWSVADLKESSAVLKLNTDAVSNWTYEDLSVAGHLMRNRIRSSYKPYNAQKDSITVNSTEPFFAPNTSYPLTIQYFSDGQLIPNSLVSYSFETDEATIDANHTLETASFTGPFNLFVTAAYNGETTCFNYLYIVSAISKGTYEEPSFLSLFDSSSIYLPATSSVEPSTSTAIYALDTVSFEDKSYQWKPILTDSIFNKAAPADSFKSYFVTYIMSPIEVHAYLNQEHIGTITYWLNGEKIIEPSSQSSLSDLLTLKEGSNMLFIECASSESLNDFYFEFLTPAKEPFKTLSFNDSPLSTGAPFYDCNNVWNGLAVIDSCGNCAGGTTGKALCGVQEPFLGTPFIVPVEIQVEHFNIGGNGSAYFDNTTALSTFDLRQDEEVEIRYASYSFEDIVVNMANQEWMNYQILVSEDGEYIVDVKVACPSSPRQLIIEAKDIVDTIHFNGTNSWFLPEVISTDTLLLKEGIQNLRITYLAQPGETCDIDWISIKENVLSTNKQFSLDDITVFPNPSYSHFKINSTKTFKYSIFTTEGKKIVSGTDEKEIGDDLKQGTYLLKIESNIGTQSFIIIKE